MHADTRDTERKLCRWLDIARQDAKAIYILGDLFDYWYEYKYVVPKGFTRILGKLADITDSGVEVHFFTGNHDMWLTDYLSGECGMKLHFEPFVTDLYGKTFFMAHGDGLGDTSGSFGFLQRVFHSKFLRVLFSAVHPRWTIPLAHAWSNHSRENGGMIDFLGEEKEYLIQFARQQLQKTPDVDFFVFGHRHLMLDYPLPPHARIILLGDWIRFFSYAVFDGNSMQLLTFR